MAFKIRGLLVAGLIVAGAGTYLTVDHRPAGPVIKSFPVERGNIVALAKATGVLEAAHTVEIGTQVSGTIQRLFVDGDSIVRKGQVLAQLDPSSERPDLDSAQAAVERSEIDRNEDEAVFENDRANLARAEALLADGLMSQEDYDAAKVQTDSDELKMKEDQAEIAVEQKGVEQAEFNLAHCTITSPMDGVVISREVDEGQTVVARVSAPGLFLVADDLSRLVLMAQVDEAYIGQIHEGQIVSFAVPSYPAAVFHGAISSMRLASSTVNNVVTYETAISISNRDLQLRPGMSANVTIETGRAFDVLRVPSVALSLPPTSQALAMSLQPDAPRGTAPAVHHVLVTRNGLLQRVPVDVGITDGTWTEVRSGDLRVGDSVVTNIVVPKHPRS